MDPDLPEPSSEPTEASADSPARPGSTTDLDAPAEQEDASPEPPQARPPRSRPPWWHHTFSSLGQRDYRYMWFSMLAFMGGVQMSFVAMGYLTYDLTGSASQLGIVYGVQAVPMLVFAPFGGVIADRFDRKRVMQIGQVLAGAVGLFVAITIWTGNIHWTHLLVMSFVYGAVFAFTMPARQAAIPDMVDKQHLSNAVALNGALLSTTFLVAPGVGGVLYALAGPDVVFFLIAGLGFLSVVLTGALPALRPKEHRVRAVFGEIRAGLEYARRTPLIRLLLLMTLVTASLAIPFRFVLPVFVVDVYERGPGSLGLLVSIMGIGSLVGSLVLASMRRLRRGATLILAGAVSGIGLLIIAAVPIFIVAAVLMVVLGLADTGRRTLTHTLMMERGDPEYRGRTMSLYLMTFGLVPLIVMPVGFAIEAWGGQVVIGAMAALLVVVSMTIWFTQDSMRELR